MREFPCRLYLTAPTGHPADVLVSMLKGALETSDIAAVLYSHEPTEVHGYLSSGEIKALQQCAIDHGAAFIVSENIALAKEIDADGVHISNDISLYPSTRSTLGDDAIVGLSVGLNRHDGMCAGEIGASYIMFDPNPSLAEYSEGQPSLEDMVKWWSGLFEVPCIAPASQIKEVNCSLISAGVDFLLIDANYWASTESANSALQEINQLINAPESGR